ncbi:MAG: EF-hand domain-containing protein [Mesorhizobium sp.]|uniref:EF-hand domain-containing protein n=1 Tax=Mesorhizobium sp. TaxID=1871066 RepID=UPI000FE654C3|nr:EF-hand domain-containing protein [Mesorhizobium sp.]RWH77400.1 MAG: EF-hand domain-containing protein [Mesorhizobium sp.]RWH77497.1 MAG: EF-hand domain-containing protein [Mesorhizobium sp.]RWH87899.1 MAG: EF-hand domain-containing protein [Mesorhizobium sp.]RWH95939.1 MAG: EF-hand domain-containing protein [Mesorhizobium sp.]RWH98182.1 MAG: EF-hand domain-containing protein [Mesorhizobium sp.]
MTLIALMRAAALAATVAAGATATAAAQTIAADPHDTTVVQAAPSPEPGGMAGQDQGAQPAQPGMMPPGMMGQGMGHGMMGAMPMMRMRGHMMKIMFAIADTDGDSALSFEEITAIHKRIFYKVDANKDGKVTSEEVQAFMRE